MGDQGIYARYILLWLALAVGAFALYTLPSIVAFRRHHPDRVFICVVNGALGMTGIGWVMALLWALSTPSEGGFAIPVRLSSEPERKEPSLARSIKRCPSCAEDVLRDAARCRFCGYVFFKASVVMVFCIILAGLPVKAADAVWYFIKWDGTCTTEPDINPAAVIQTSQALRSSYKTVDTLDPVSGQIVGVTIFRQEVNGAEGSYTFFRTLDRCEAAVEAKKADVNKYR